MKVSIRFEKTQTDGYDIVIDRLPTIRHEGKVLIVTNPKVAGLHLQTLLAKIEASECYIVTVPDGESYKTMETIGAILDRAFDHRFDRQSLFVAFGGGVIGDMTGFAASIYQRGIGFVQIPTTLLSQVDASVGGKTGVNNRFGKNLIGAFYQPRAVYIDTTFLHTLPKREFAAGVAEIVKMAVMFDADFFQWLQRHDLTKDEEALRHAIKRSVEIKADVVAKDEKEKGLRAVLNYGHTFAHVIENLSGYGRYLHGEAVAIGMTMANHLAVTLGMMHQEEAEAIKRLLARYDLPLSLAIEDVEDFYARFFLDKKSQNNRLTFILPKGIGRYAIVDHLQKEDLLALLSHYQGVEGGVER